MIRRDVTVERLGIGGDIRGSVIIECWVSLWLNPTYKLAASSSF